MSLLLLGFGLADILAGLSLWQPHFFTIYWFTAVGWAVFLKGLYSVLMSYMNGYYLDWLGWIDVVVALVLLAGWFPPVLWVLPMAKGIYTLMGFYTRWHH